MAHERVGRANEQASGRRNPKPNWEGAGVNRLPVTFNLTEFYPVSNTTHIFSPQAALFYLA